MILKYFAMGASIGVAMYSIKEYIFKKCNIQQYIAKRKAKKEQCILHAEKPFEVEIDSAKEIPDIPDVPFVTTSEVESHSAYRKLSDILDTEEYKLEAEPVNELYITNTYSTYTEKELEAIYESEAELAEEEHPTEEEPTDEELSGYYIPDEDLYDENVYEPDDAGPPINNGAVEIDEDEFENCPYNCEVYYYYGPSSTIIDDDGNYIGSERDDWILDLFGKNTFSDLRTKADAGEEPIIFIRNDKVEIAYKVIYANEEYDK